MEKSGASILIMGGCDPIGSTTIDLPVRDYSAARIMCPTWSRKYRCRWPRLFEMNSAKK